MSDYSNNFKETVSRLKLFNKDILINIIMKIIYDNILFFISILDYFEWRIILFIYIVYIIILEEKNYNRILWYWIIYYISL